MSEVKVDKISPRSGTDVTLGDASDTFTIPASATLDVNGTIDVTGATVTGLSAGKILQVVQSSKTGQITKTSTTIVTTELTGSITPASTSNKVLIFTFLPCGSSTCATSYTSRMISLALYRGTVADTKLTQASYVGRNLIGANSNDAYDYACHTFMYLDSPSTTSAQTYTVGMLTLNDTLTVQAHAYSDTSYMTLMEVEA